MGDLGTVLRFGMLEWRDLRGRYVCLRAIVVSCHAGGSVFHAKGRLKCQERVALLLSHHVTVGHTPSPCPPHNLRCIGRSLGKQMPRAGGDIYAIKVDRSSGVNSEVKRWRGHSRCSPYLDKRLRSHSRSAPCTAVEK